MKRDLRDDDDLLELYLRPPTSVLPNSPVASDSDDPLMMAMKAVRPRAPPATTETRGRPTAVKSQPPLQPPWVARGTAVSGVPGVPGVSGVLLAASCVCGGHSDTTNAADAPHAATLDPTDAEVVLVEGPSTHGSLQHPGIKLCLHLKYATAKPGAVLEYCKTYITSLISHGPTIYKIGATWRPIHRWENKSYGYKHDVQKWTAMHVLHRDNSKAIGFLEAALIAHFKDKVPSGLQNEASGGEGLGSCPSCFLYVVERRLPMRPPPPEGCRNQMR
jgi:hypothetical protein